MSRFDAEPLFEALSPRRRSRAARVVMLAPALLLAMSGMGLLAALAAPAAAQEDAPCTDGVFGGDVGAHYQQILDAHASNPNGSFYSTLPAEKQAFVTECAGKDGPDIERYELRETLIQCGQTQTVCTQTEEVCTNTDPTTGACTAWVDQCIATQDVCVQENVIGRVYEYLDPLPTEVCDGTGSTRTCRQGQYYYVALVLSGCYTDNVFGDEEYAENVGWGEQGAQSTTYRRLRSSDEGVGTVGCEGDPGFDLQPLVVDLAGSGAHWDGNQSIINDADSPQFNEQIVSNETNGTTPFGFQAATSTVWNMLLSTWDVGDNNGTGTEERDGDEGLWTSPWANADTAADGAPANLLCDGTSCELGYGSTWFDSGNMWEWQVVYEMRWDVSTCDAIDPSAWTVAFDGDLTHASPNKKNWEFCGDVDNQAALTLIKDTLPLEGTPWGDFRFTVTGPTPSSALLQDPGASECQNPNPWADCADTDTWDNEDRVTFTDLSGSDNPIVGGPYVITETGGPETNIEDYPSTAWICRNVDPMTCTPEVVASADNPLDLAACAAVAVPSGCNAVGWNGGVASGTGKTTGAISLCRGTYTICRFVNEGVCLESENAIGDLQVFGGVQPEQASFATGAVPVQSGDTEDAIFMSSFMPIPDQSRWPGNVDNFVLPLPVVENEDGDFVPDTSETCDDQESTGCLAWRAGEEILAQAPTAAGVASDRKIGVGADERRVTYTQEDFAVAVPRSSRAFDWSDSDALADEYDLWRGLGIDFTEGDLTSEGAARSLARSIINETLRIHETTIVDADAPSGTRTISHVLGDFFHGDSKLVGGPANFFYLAQDLEGNGAECDESVNPNKGYRCFFEKHRRRRRVLLAPSNDGQLHAFDAGQFVGSVVDQTVQGSFTFGTGKEVFAHIPRPMLEHTADMTTQEHDFGIDGGLLVDDVFIDPVHDGNPSAQDRQWRTVVFGTYREGGRGVFALDLTQPDPVVTRNVVNFAGQPDIEFLPDPDSTYVAGCSALDSVPEACGELPYPAVLWEFEDLCSTQDADTGTTFTTPCDEDGNGFQDLALSWSQVNTGRVLVNVDGEEDPVAKFVAIFGGGLDPDNETTSGNFLYMVDVETGQAIYKRALDSGVPSEPAAVDTDQNGFIDTIYVGTVGGRMYKVNVASPADVSPSSGRIDDASQWAPFAIFDTEDRPIFFPPTVTFVASQGRYALAFGTGDREDLFADTETGVEGRFYMILDQGFAAGVGPLAGGPLTETSFQQIPVSSVGVDGDFLTAPLNGRLPGWVLQLGPDSRVVSKALALAGLLVFTTFDPETELVCEFGGLGQIFALRATNANSIAGIDEPRAMTVEGFAGQPVVMPSGMNQTAQNGEVSDPFEAARIQGIRRSLMDLFPADCRFGNFSLNVGVTLSNTSQVPIASVPVCVTRRNWTEHF